MSIVGFAIGCVIASSASGQKPATEKFKHARVRSEDSARILSLLAEPNSGFPKELINKAQMVAVIPRATREDILVRRFLEGYGVISARQQTGWSLPAFYRFVSAPRKFSGTSHENLALILLFMDKDALLWFDKNKSQFKRERAGVLGPVGIITEEQSKNLSGKGIIAYTYYNGKLNGNNIDPDFFKDFILDQDNNINVPIYGGKAREILAGEKSDVALLPAGISAFQEVLQRYWPIP